MSEARVGNSQEFETDFSNEIEEGASEVKRLKKENILNKSRSNKIDILDMDADLETKKKAAKCTAHSAYRVCSIDKLNELKSLIELNEGDLLFVKSTEGRIDDDGEARYRVYAYNDDGTVSFIGDVSEWL